MNGKRLICFDRNKKEATKRARLTKEQLPAGITPQSGGGTARQGAKKVRDCGGGGMGREGTNWGEKKGKKRGGGPLHRQGKK